MRAWQYMGSHAPIRMNEVPEPVPTPTQVVIDVRAAGLCHSDIMYMETGDHAMPFLPMTQGHENAGVISALGEEVTGFAVGDIEEVCALMAAGEIRPAYEEIAFEEIGAGLERLKAAQVTGRLVARFGG